MENRIALHEILQAGSTRINYTALYLFQRFAAAARQESEMLFPRWGKRLGEVLVPHLFVSSKRNSSKGLTVSKHPLGH